MNAKRSLLLWAVMGLSSVCFEATAQSAPPSFYSGGSRFKGSSVEHPINAPPGADREVRRPERRPDFQGGADGGKKTPAGEIDEQLAGEKEIPKWPWFVGIGIALLVVVSYFLKSRRRMVS